MSLRMAAITNMLLHMKPTLAWEMYDPGYVLRFNIPYLNEEFQDANLLHFTVF
jgi:hypothetical protein